MAAKQWHKNEKLKLGERLAYIKGKTQYEMENQTPINNVACIPAVSKVLTNSGLDLWIVNANNYNC